MIFIGPAPINDCIIEAAFCSDFELACFALESFNYLEVLGFTASGSAPLSTVAQLPHDKNTSVACGKSNSGVNSFGHNMNLSRFELDLNIVIS